jgi:long-chain acyl-CoA synthetase
MEKIWLDNYPPGVPSEIDLGELQSLPEYFAREIKKHGSRSAFASGTTKQEITYNELDHLSDIVGCYLQQILKLPKGSRVALMMPNLLQYPICLLGVLKAGYIVVNVNPQYTSRELKNQLIDSGAVAIIIVELFAYTLEKIYRDTSLEHIIVTGLADMLPTAKRMIANIMIRQVKKMIPAYSFANSINWLKILQYKPHTPLTTPSLTLDDIAFLQYTGGTTGASKGAMLTHRNILSNLTQSRVWLDPFVDKNKTQISITAIPLYHIYALSFCLGGFAWGGLNVLVSDPRNTKAFIDVLKHYPFTTMPAVNTLFNSLVQDPEFKKVDFSHLQAAFGGGSAVQRPVAQKWQNITKSPIAEGYGLTECSPLVTSNRADITEYNGTIGVPIPSTMVAIRNALGEEVALGEVGELCVKGPQVMKGYWQKPDETAAVFTADGYLRTGDMATMDNQGFLKIVDRLKDMIIVSGFNVYPTEIEEVVQMHPGVFEVACVGQKNEKTGEMVKLFIVKKDANLTKEDIIVHCKENLTNYKMPKEIVFLDTLPKTPVGKILRRELKEA